MVLFSDICLCLNLLDSKYGNAAYLAPAFKHDNLVNLTRFRAGMKVWARPNQANTQGRPKIYGEKYYLHFESQFKDYRHPKTKLTHSVFQRSIFELPYEVFYLSSRFLINVV